MLDIKMIRENVEEVIQKLSTRGGDFSYLRDVYKMDVLRRDYIFQVEKLKNERNEKSKAIGALKRQNLDATEAMNQVSDIGNEIKRLDDEIKNLDDKIKYLMLTTPNIVHSGVKVGTSEKDNVEIKKYLEPTVFSFEPKDHYQLGENLGILDFERASKITGARFVVYKGLGARLERSLMSFMMDLHSKEHGYVEMIPPFIVNRDSMVGTGQFPKFEEDSFKLYGDYDWYLNPTAEVPTINYYRDEILEGDSLPIKYVSYTSAFRSEAGSAGRDTKGILRQHQFQKVELIKFTKPEDSYKEHDLMLENSEKVLKLLEIPYRVIELCTGDIGFGMAKTYDIEVWLPGQNAYREIGSISNAEEYQARRANIRFRRSANSKTEYVHTLNGSGLAIGRTIIAILENYQNQDGTVRVPEVLIPYMGTKIIG